MGLVQSKSISQAAGATLQLSFDSPTSSKNSIIAVGLSSASTDVLSISDGSNTYTALTAVSSTPVSRLFHSINIGTSVSTLTLSGITGISLLAIHEFSGVISFESTVSAAGTGNTQDAGNITTLSKNELLFGYTAGTISGFIISLAPNFLEAAQLLVDNSNTIAMLTAWQNVSNIGTYDYSSSSTASKGGTFSWNAQTTAFVSSQSLQSNHQQFVKYRG